MKPIPKRNIFIMLAAVIVGALILFIYIRQHPTKKAFSYQVIKTVKAAGKDDIELLGDHDEYLLTKNLYLIGDRYLLGLGYQEVNYQFGDISETSERYTNFVYYDLDHDLKSKTVDVSKKVKTIHKNAWVSRINGPGRFSFDYKNMVSVTYNYPLDKGYSKDKELYYSLDSGTYYTPTTADNLSDSDRFQNRNVGYHTNLYDKIQELGYIYGYDDLSIEKFKDTKVSDVDTNINLYSDFPELKGKLNKGQGYQFYTRYKQTNLFEEEWFNTLLHWFAPKGQETLSGVKIKSAYSIDGQEHEVHSYAEFMQYYNKK